MSVLASVDLDKAFDNIPSKPIWDLLKIRNVKHITRQTIKGLNLCTTNHFLEEPEKSGFTNYSE